MGPRLLALLLGIGYDGTAVATQSADCEAETASRIAWAPGVEEKGRLDCDTHRRALWFALPAASRHGGISVQPARDHDPARHGPAPRHARGTLAHRSAANS